MWAATEMSGHAGGLLGLTWARKSKTTRICLVYPMSTYHLLHLQQGKKSVFAANFMGFGCKGVIFAFFECRQLFLCFKEKTVAEQGIPLWMDCAGMRSVPAVGPLSPPQSES